MTDFQVEKTGSIGIQARVTNPFGTSEAEFLESYQPGIQIQSQEVKEKEYKNLQKAEANYFLAGIGLKNSSAVSNFNLVAKQNGYGNVNTLHRHDIN